MSGVRDYQCWPDGDGRVYLRHKCKENGVNNAYYTTLLPKGRWKFDGQKVTPSVNCSTCGFHMFIEKTHDEEPALCPKCNSPNIGRFHHEGTFAIPECNYKRCEDCEHQWDHL